MRCLLILICFANFIMVSAQVNWSWQPLAPLPMPTANNAVCSAVVNSDQRVYSFGGITTGLELQNIHREAYMYSSASGNWTVLPQIPDTSGKIASAASVVDGVAYVVGGYHVFPTSPFERSSDRVHRLDLNTNSWLTDGATIPIPIDDHVQAVWRDSLIFVITGWSQNTNVPAVQIYDPALDLWSVGTPVPNNNSYKAFGASGTIIGDTIFYYGGASSSGSFGAQDDLRIGVIDPTEPTQITWLPAVATLRNSYRSGCGSYNGRPFWLGGSAISYNYDAVAYNGSGIVSPVAEVGVLNYSGTLVASPTDQAVMDIRGIGQTTNGSFHICGGIGSGALVLDTHWLIQPVLGLSEQVASRLQLYPNPSTGIIHFSTSLTVTDQVISVIDALGRKLRTEPYLGNPGSMDLSDLAPGQYLMELSSRTSVTRVRFWLVN